MYTDYVGLQCYEQWIQYIVDGRYARSIQHCYVLLCIVMECPL